MHKAIFENVFYYRGRAFGQRVERHELGLHVGGEGREGCGVYVDCLAALTASVEMNPVWPQFQPAARLFQFA